MIGQMEIAFSISQIAKAEARLAYQIKVVENLRPESDWRFAALAENVLDLMSDRLTLLQERHEKLVVAAFTSKTIDEQIESGASMIVGDPRKPEARHRLDKGHQKHLRTETRHGVQGATSPVSN